MVKYVFPPLYLWPCDIAVPLIKTWNVFLYALEPFLCYVTLTGQWDIKKWNAHTQKLLKCLHIGTSFALHPPGTMWTNLDECAAGWEISIPIIPGAEQQDVWASLIPGHQLNHGQFLVVVILNHWDLGWS